MDIILLLIIIFLPILSEIKIKSTYNKYLKIQCNSKITGKEVAQKILEKNDINNISIEKIGGTLSDHYNPKSKNICLSTPIYEQSTISSISVAAHECGHALQDKEGYSFFKFRSNLVPIVNITSRISSLFIILGFFLEFFELLEIGIELLLVGLLFQLVTLPVEFDASKRGRIQLQKLGLITEKETNGVKKVLSAAALTYVAGFLAEALQVLRLVLLSRRRH